MPAQKRCGSLESARHWSHRNSHVPAGLLTVLTLVLLQATHQCSKWIAALERICLYYESLLQNVREVLMRVLLLRNTWWASHWNVTGFQLLCFQKSRHFHCEQTVCFGIAARKKANSQPLGCIFRDGMREGTLGWPGGQIEEERKVFLDTNWHVCLLARAHVYLERVSCSVRT